MKKKSNPVVFFGSGPVAARSLELLIKHQDIAAIVTKPATLNLMQTVIPEVPVYAVSSKNELDELVNNKSFPDKLGILIDFGIIVSKQVINYFEYGIINSHFSLLQQWRGADPITFSLLSGQPETGVSLMLLTPELDEGPILSQARYEIPARCTNEQLSEELVNLSDILFSECTDIYLDGDIIPINQEPAAALLGLEYHPTYSRKLSKEDGKIDWTKPAEELEREIRAFHSWPKSYTSLNGIDVLIRDTNILENSGQPGTYEFTKKTLTVYCGYGALDIKMIQPSGKKEMPIQAFLAGYKL